MNQGWTNEHRMCAIPLSLEQEIAISGWGYVKITKVKSRVNSQNTEVGEIGAKPDQVIKLPISGQNECRLGCWSTITYKLP